MIETEAGEGGTIDMKWERERKYKSEGIREKKGRGWRGNFLNGNYGGVIY